MCETKNENSSNLLRGISENGGILFYGIDSTAIVRRMEQLHKTSAVTTAALGRLLTGVAMMGQMLKSDSDSVTVQIKGGGPAGRILAVSNGAGDVKGYVENSIVELPPRADGHLNVGAAMFLLGYKHGYSSEELEKIMTKSLEPTGMILLVTACGGVLRYMLQNSGLGDVIGNAVSSASLPLVVVAFIVAALVRISVGSSTVAMTMAAGIIAAMPGISELSPLYLACVTAAIAGGSTVCSHFNDSGFWLVKSLVGMDEKTTLKTWTIMETLVGGVGFLVALVISFFA